RPRTPRAAVDPGPRTSPHAPALCARGIGLGEREGLAGCRGGGSTAILCGMTKHFVDLLSSRGRIGWGGPVATQRPPMNPNYEFGGGFPDPVSFSVAGT